MSCGLMCNCVYLRCVVLLRLHFLNADRGLDILSMNELKSRALSSDLRVPKESGALTSLDNSGLRRDP